MTLSLKYQQQQKSENKLRTLRQILCDMERYRQKACPPPTKVNIKGAKSVLGIKEHQSRLKTFYDSKRNITTESAAKLLECNLICRNCTKQYKTILKEMNASKEKLEQSALNKSTQWQRIDLRKQRSGDITIDREYERLQQKYCPKFHLYGANKTESHATFKPIVAKTNKNIKTKRKNPKSVKKEISQPKPLVDNPVAAKQQGDLEFNKQQKGGEETQGDSDKTLTPEQTSEDAVNNNETKEIPIEDYSDIEQYRVQYQSKPSPPSNIYTRMHPFNSRCNLKQYSKHNLSVKKSSKILIHDCDYFTNTTASSMAAIFGQYGNHLYKNNSDSRKSKNFQSPQYTPMKEIFFHQQQAPENEPTPSCDILGTDEYFAQELRLAIEQDGGTADPTLNDKLATVIEKALKNKMSWTKIKTIIDDVSQTRKDQVLHLLQIQLQERVYILCTVRTSDFSFLMSKLDRIMKQFRARFVPVLQHFSHCCVIEAIVPMKWHQLSAQQLQCALQHDANSFKVKKINVIDMSKGEVCIKCQPISMSKIVKMMTDKGYDILASDYGFRANKQIVLDSFSGSQYRKFIKSLLSLPDIETICDNVLY